MLMVSYVQGLQALLDEELGITTDQYQPKAS